MLETILSPKDIKKLTLPELIALAEETRALIIETVTRQGGHIASSLGAVELIIAIHYVLDVPIDKLIFDVGHQAYAHKILTGRAAGFHDLRAEGGVSGFPKMAESEYDCFTGGHASNAISAALGMVRARKMRGEKHAVVALVGDGAMTGGMCYEALNDAGQYAEPMLVILNDNEMSISKNVGALSAYFTGLRKNAVYTGTKRAVKRGLNFIPLVGPFIVRGVDFIKRVIRNALLRDQFFEKLGFDYYGPIDGHDIRRLIRTLKKVKDSERPVLLHVATQKGRGYQDAEAHPDQYHGLAPNPLDPREQNVRRTAGNGELIAGWLLEMADRNPSIAVMTAAMPLGTGMTAFARRHPRRFFDVGIAEEHMVTMAAGMAAAGMRPYIAVYSSFLQRGYDQLIHDVCIANLPVTILVDRGGLVGADGSTHQGVYDLSYLRQMPGMVVASPRDANDLKRMLRLSAHIEGPMAIRYPRDSEDLGERFRSEEPLKVGQWEELAVGRDAVILAVGQMVPVALQAAVELAAHRVECGVIDARFVKPLDEALLKDAAGRYPLIVTLEENALAGGFGSAALECLSAWGAAPNVLTLGVPDRFIEHATIERQRECCGLNAAQVAQAVLGRLSAEQERKSD